MSTTRDATPEREGATDSSARADAGVERARAEAHGMARYDDARPTGWRATTMLAVSVSLLVALATVVLLPVAAPLVLGAWGARLARPLAARLARVCGGMRIPAVLLTAALLLFLVVPTAIAVTSVLPGLRGMITQLRDAGDSRYALEALVSDGDSAEVNRGFDYISLGREFGASASRAFLIVASTSLTVIVGIVVFLTSFFAFVADGERAGAWLEANAPVDGQTFRRLAAAFNQAGRGLIVGSGLTALAQGALATVIYVGLGIPRAALLGLLSVAFALVPMTGPIFVWVPVAAGLALKGETGKAITLALLGFFLVGTVDNVLRPWLSRRANLGLSSPMALVAILGGVAAFGPWGIIFGPLGLRLAREALEIAREKGAFGRSPLGASAASAPISPH